MMSSRLAALPALLVVAGGGCARGWLAAKPPVEYRTVAADSQGDEELAAAKHAEALVFLDDLRWTKDLDKAERLLNEALVADVGFGPAHNSLGMIYFLQEKLYLAAWEFQYAAKLLPDLPQPYNNLGLVYERAGKYQEAADYYSMALARNAHHPDVLANLLRVRMIQGDNGSDMAPMLSDLALSHPDPEWRQWAREQAEHASFNLGPDELYAPRGGNAQRSVQPDLDLTPETLPMPPSAELLELQTPESVLPLP